MVAPIWGDGQFGGAFGGKPSIDVVCCGVKISAENRIGIFIGQSSGAVIELGSQAGLPPRIGPGGAVGNRELNNFSRQIDCALKAAKEKIILIIFIIPSHGKLVLIVPDRGERNFITQAGLITIPTQSGSVVQ